MNEQSTPEYAGVINISRRSGRTTLFNSPFVHDGFISLRISSAVVERSLSERKVRPASRPHIEVLLSYSQFAEAITTLNMGCGVPCTISSRDGQHYEMPDLVDERKDIDAEMDAAAAKMIDAARALIEQVETVPGLSKSNRQMLASQAYSILRVINDSMPFISERYREYLDQLEQRAKTEIAAYVDLAVREHGLQSLQQAVSLPAIASVKSN